MKPGNHYVSSKRKHLRYFCDQCEQTFQSDINLFIHKRIHLSENPFTCELCKEAFPSKLSLFEHKRTHKGEKPFQCDMCHQSFNQRSLLAQHKLDHFSNKKYTCEICKETFNDKQSATDHRKAHQGEKPFLCNMCSKAYRKKCSLYNHMKTHLEEMDENTCSVCGSKFQSPSDVENHKKLHTVLSCVECGNFFDNVTCLARHKYIIHTKKYSTISRQVTYKRKKPPKVKNNGISIKRRKRNLSLDRANLATYNNLQTEYIVKSDEEDNAEEKDEKNSNGIIKNETEESPDQNLRREFCYVPVNESKEFMNFPKTIDENNGDFPEDNVSSLENLESMKSEELEIKEEPIGGAANSTTEEKVDVKLNFLPKIGVKNEEFSVKEECSQNVKKTDSIILIDDDYL